MFLPCEFMLIIEKVNKREGERGWRKRERERERERERLKDSRQTHER